MASSQLRSEGRPLQTNSPDKTPVIWEAQNVKKGWELMGVYMLSIDAKILTERFRFRTSDELMSLVNTNTDLPGLKRKALTKRLYRFLCSRFLIREIVLKAMGISSSKAVVANRMPWMNARGDKDKLSCNIDSHQLLKGSKVSMKLKGKIFGGYLDLFPNVDHQHRGGVRLQSLERSKDSEEDGPRQNGSSAETYILEMDKL
ncbi:hypothetical protein Bca101_030956 [Brassica carinata]